MNYNDSKYNYSNNNMDVTMNNINQTSNSEGQTKSSKKKKIIAIISSVVILLIVIIIVMVLIFKGKDKDKKKIIIRDDDSDEPIANVSYNKNEIKFFNVEKNISSKIVEENDERQQNETFNYICILGVKNKLESENVNNKLFEGFFAILRTSLYNKTLHRYQIIRKNDELEEILNENLNDNFLRTAEEYSFPDDEDEDTKEQIKPFLKLVFYQNGTYKDIFKPYNLADNSFNEMKEILDLALPKIITKGVFYEQSDPIISEKKKKEKLLACKHAKLLNKKNKKNHIKILTLNKNKAEGNEDDNNGYLVKDENGVNSYYIDNQEIEYYTDLLDEEEKNKTYVNNTKETINDNLTKLDTFKNSSVFSEFTEYRGSNKTTNVTTIIDESQGMVKEIFAKTFMNLSRQEYLSQTDKDVYNDENYIKEEDVILEDKEINVTNDTSGINNGTKEDNNTGTIYNMLDANNVISIIDHHIIINSSFLNESLIEKIYNNYLDNFKYESYEISSTILNKLKSLVPSKDLNKYKIIEGDDIRTLEEDEKNDYYGLKKFSRRKDVFQTNFLGLDISLGLANTYFPSTGLAYNAFKVDIGDYKISLNIKSFETNEPIITENIQQMGFKLLKLMNLTHYHLEEQQNIYSQKINSIFNEILDSGILNIEESHKYSSLNEYYSLFSNNKEKYQKGINYFLNNLSYIENFVGNSTLMASFNSSETFLNDCFVDFMNNITFELNNQFENINKTISMINEEIEKNKNIGFHPYLYEDYIEIINKIKNYLDNVVEKEIKKEFEKKEILYEYQIKDKLNKELNLNRINMLKNSIEQNNIYNYIYSTKEKNSILSYLNNYIESKKNNIESFSLNNFKFSEKFDELNITEMSNTFSRIATSSANIMKTNLLKYDDYVNLEKYFTQMDIIDQSINNIITLYLKDNTIYLNSQVTNIYEILNDMSFNLENIMNNMGRSIIDFLNKVKKEKYLNILEFHNKYFEKNVMNFYNNFYKKKE